MQGEIVSEPEAHWKAVFSSILDTNTDTKENFYLNDQQEALLTALGGIGHCGPKKKEGILAAYLILEPKYRYDVKLPEWRTAEDTQELEAKNAAMDMVRNFVQNNPDKPTQAKALMSLVNANQSFLNDTQIAELGSAYILPPPLQSDTYNKIMENSNEILSLVPQESYEEEFWDSISIKVQEGPKSSTKHIEVLNENGALALINAFEQEENKKIAEEKSIQFVANMVKHFMDTQFAADNDILKELTGVDVMPQGVHQMLYLKNLIGNRVGVSQTPEWDPHTGVLYDDLLETSPTDALNTFFKHVTPDRLADEIVSVVNAKIDENRKILAPLLEDKYWNDSDPAGLTRLGAVALLSNEKLGFFKPSIVA
ncbi:MAG TPA: hypothetical protein VGP47_02070 [Parachlamydiaceae bacterium]|nr:hypothetical protein [Parachlamydiaceae bacterium]